MSPLRAIHRGVSRVARTVRYGWRASVDASRSSTDVLYPEYDAYDRQPRRMAPVAAALLLAAAGVLGTYLALSHGLGNLILGSFTSRTNPGGSTQVAPGVPSNAPTPHPSPTVPGQPAPTVTVVSVAPGPHSTATATVTASPTHTKKHGQPSATPTGPDPSPTPSDTPTTPDPEGSSPSTPPTPDPSGSTEGP